MKKGVTGKSRRRKRIKIYTMDIDEMLHNMVGQPHEAELQCHNKNASIYL